jgi:hypothetical protein
MDGLKPWNCKKCAATLGQVKRNGSGIRQLLLYRHAVSMDAEKPVDVDVLGALEGTMMDIRCDICGTVRTWEIGREAAQRVVKMYLAE